MFSLLVAQIPPGRARQELFEVLARHNIEFRITTDVEYLTLYLQSLTFKDNEGTSTPAGFSPIDDVSLYEMGSTVPNPIHSELVQTATSSQQQNASAPQLPSSSEVDVLQQEERILQNGPGSPVAGSVVQTLHPELNNVTLQPLDNSLYVLNDAEAYLADHFNEVEDARSSEIQVVPAEEQQNSDQASIYESSMSQTTTIDAWFRSLNILANSAIQEDCDEANTDAGAVGKLVLQEVMNEASKVDNSLLSEADAHIANYADNMESINSVHRLDPCANNNEGADGFYQLSDHENDGDQTLKGFKAVARSSQMDKNLDQWDGQIVQQDLENDDYADWNEDCRIEDDARRDLDYSDEQGQEVKGHRPNLDAYMDCSDARDERSDGIRSEDSLDVFDKHGDDEQQSAEGALNIPEETNTQDDVHENIDHHNQHLKKRRGKWMIRIDRETDDYDSDAENNDGYSTASEIHNSEEIRHDDSDALRIRQEGYCNEDGSDMDFDDPHDHLERGNECGIEEFLRRAPEVFTEHAERNSEETLHRGLNDSGADAYQVNEYLTDADRQHEIASNNYGKKGGMRSEDNVNSDMGDSDDGGGQNDGFRSEHDSHKDRDDSDHAERNCGRPYDCYVHPAQNIVITEVDDFDKHADQDEKYLTQELFEDEFNDTEDSSKHVNRPGKWMIRINQKTDSDSNAEKTNGYGFNDNIHEENGDFDGSIERNDGDNAKVKSHHNMNALCKHTDKFHKGHVRNILITEIDDSDAEADKNEEYFAEFDTDNGKASDDSVLNENYSSENIVHRDMDASISDEGRNDGYCLEDDIFHATNDSDFYVEHHDEHLNEDGVNQGQGKHEDQKNDNGVNAPEEHRNYGEEGEFTVDSDAYTERNGCSTVIKNADHSVDDDEYQDTDDSDFEAEKNNGYNNSDKVIQRTDEYRSEDDVYQDTDDFDADAMCNDGYISETDLKKEIYDSDKQLKQSEGCRIGDAINMDDANTDKNGEYRSENDAHMEIDDPHAISEQSNELYSKLHKNAEHSDACIVQDDEFSPDEPGAHEDQNDDNGVSDDEYQDTDDSDVDAEKNREYSDSEKLEQGIDDEDSMQNNKCSTEDYVCRLKDCSGANEDRNDAHHTQPHICQNSDEQMVVDDIIEHADGNSVSFAEDDVQLDLNTFNARAEQYDDNVTRKDSIEVVDDSNQCVEGLNLHGELNTSQDLNDAATGSDYIHHSEDISEVIEEWIIYFDQNDRNGGDNIYDDMIYFIESARRNRDGHVGDKIHKDLDHNAQDASGNSENNEVEENVEEMDDSSPVIVQETLTASCEQPHHSEERATEHISHLSNDDISPQEVYEEMKEWFTFDMQTNEATDQNKGDNIAEDDEAPQGNTMLDSEICVDRDNAHYTNNKIVPDLITGNDDERQFHNEANLEEDKSNASCERVDLDAEGGIAKDFGKPYENSDRNAEHKHGDHDQLEDSEKHAYLKDEAANPEVFKTGEFCNNLDENNPELCDTVGTAKQKDDDRSRDEVTEDLECVDQHVERPVRDGTLQYNVDEEGSMLVNEHEEGNEETQNRRDSDELFAKINQVEAPEHVHQQFKDSEKQADLNDNVPSSEKNVEEDEEEWIIFDETLDQIDENDLTRAKHHVQNVEVIELSDDSEDSDDDLDKDDYIPEVAINSPSTSNAFRRTLPVPIVKKRAMAVTTRGRKTQILQQCAHDIQQPSTSRTHAMFDVRAKPLNSSARTAHLYKGAEESRDSDDSEEFVEYGEVDDGRCISKIAASTSKLSAGVKTQFVRRGNYSCDTCGSSFSSLTALFNHMRIHVNEKQFKCIICKMTFLTATLLKAHLRVHTGEKPFKCNVCYKVFDDSSNLADHKLIHTRVSFKCDSCPKSFLTRAKLRSHIMLHTDEKRLQMESGHRVCYSATYGKHQIRHTGERPHRCDVSQKRFTSCDQVKMNKEIHIGEKPCGCDVYYSRFGQSANLGQHMRLPNGERQLQCQNYENSFYTRPNFSSSERERHRLIHCKKPYKCDVCGMSFVAFNQLVRHQIVHTGIKLYECDLCYKKCSTTSLLGRHKLQHRQQV